MRDVIHEVVSQEQAEDPQMNKRFRELVQWHRNPKYLRDLDEDARRFKQLMAKTEDAEQTYREATSGSAPGAEPKAPHA
jgi:hypothetical protein